MASNAIFFVQLMATPLRNKNNIRNKNELECDKFVFRFVKRIRKIF